MQSTAAERTEIVQGPRAAIAGASGSGKSLLCERLGSYLTARETTEPDGTSAASVLLVADATAGAASELLAAIAAVCASGAAHVVVAVNKLDLLGFSREAFERIADAAEALARHFHGTRLTVVPVSALTGDNVESPSARMPWYTGPTLTGHLLKLATAVAGRELPLRFHVAEVERPDHDRRLYAGTIHSGTLRRGEPVQVAVSGARSVVASIEAAGGARDQAGPGEDVAIALADHIDVAAGDVLSDGQSRPEIAEQFAAHVLWLSDEPLLPGRDYTLKMGTRALAAGVNAVKYRIDPATAHQEVARTLRRGEVGACTIAASAPVAIDPFASFPRTGRFTLRDRQSDAIMAAGVVDFALRRGVNVHAQPLAVTKSMRAALKRQAPCILWFTGLSGAGKSTVANLVEAKLAAAGSHTYMLDGDNIRHGLTKDLGFTPADRVENIRRVGEVAKLFVDAGLIVLCSFISPFRAERSAVRGLVANGEFIEIFVNAPLDVCERRDPKGLYAKSRAGRLPNFTGIDSPYEAPEHPDLVLDTASAPAEALADKVIAHLQSRSIVSGDSLKRR
jgi:bifunctional enzyme CysN/CysC